MNITKVKKDGDKIIIRWSEDADTSEKKTDFACYDPPLDSFTEAFEALGPAALGLIMAPHAWRSLAKVSGVSITHEEDRIGAVITLLVDLDGATKGPLVINTPYLVDEDENGPMMPPDMLNAVDAIMKEAEKYVRGERAQRDFFADDAADSESEAA
ncbi:hypothetical protein [Roseovarius sp. SYSU LYC5161]|uniref:hypothetical protein n=1 Tax=Roseovarius halophilus (ex Wu et al. 2025) TaxID=3376060 RepID=UPI00399A07BA